MRIQYLILTEVIIFASLSLIIYAHTSGSPKDIRILRGVAIALGIVVFFATTMLIGGKRFLKPFARAVGLCELCEK